MRKEEDSGCPREVMVDTAKRMGKKCVALITDMGQPLGRFAGHSNEVIESIEILKGRGATDLRELSLELSAWMFFLGERTKTLDEGRALANEMVTSGKALDKFRDCIRLQGAIPRVIDEPSLLPAPRSRLEVKSPSSGFIVDIKLPQSRHRTGHARWRPRKKGTERRPRGRPRIPQAHWRFNQSRRNFGNHHLQCRCTTLRRAKND